MQKPEKKIEAYLFEEKYGEEWRVRGSGLHPIDLGKDWPRPWRNTPLVRLDEE